MISIYCNSNKLVNRMGANVLRSTALISRRNNISKLINHHYNNNNLQSLRSFSYKFDPPTSSNNKVTLLLGVGLGLTTGILIGAFGIHVDGSLKNNGLGISVGRSNEWYQHAAITTSIMQANINSGCLLAQAVQSQTAPEVAAERYLVSVANYINIQCLTNPNSIDDAERLKEIKKALSNLERLVKVKGDNDDYQLYELLKDNGMDSCVVKGPLHLSDGFLVMDSYKGAEIITVKRDDVYSRLNAPVECFGLVGDKSHLNGKLGTIFRTDSEERRNFLISFEDVSVGRTWVPRQNLRRVVNLPIFREDLPYQMVPPFTPVVCQGLVSDHEKHLNNKRGTVLSLDYENNYAMVVFENPTIPDTRVHLKNLFLSRELPKRFMPSTSKSKDKRG